MFCNKKRESHEQLFFGELFKFTKWNLNEISKHSMYMLYLPTFIVPWSFGDRIIVSDLGVTDSLDKLRMAFGRIESTNL